MPTTTSTAKITRQKLVSRAYRRIGIDNPSVDQVLNAVDLLNDIVKELDTEGRWLWTISNTASTLLLITNQRAYAAGVGASLIQPNIMFLEWVEIVTGTSRKPLKIITELESVSNILRQSTGELYLVYLEQAADKASRRMHFFPTPSAARSVEYSYRRQLYDFGLATDNPDFPQDWAQTLIKRLAYELAPESGLPLEERALLKAEMEEAMTKRQKANAERPTARPEKSQYF